MSTVDQKLTINDRLSPQVLKDGEPAWLTELRQQAWETFLRLPLPSTKEEDWRRFDLRGFRWEDYHLATPPPYTVVSSVQQLPDPIQSQLRPADADQWAGLMVFHGPRRVFSYLSEAARAKGVLMDELTTDQPTDIVWQSHLHALIRPDTSKFVAAHAALMNAGVVVVIPPKLVLEKPLHLFFWLDEPGAALFDHILVIARRDSQVTVVLHYASPENLPSGLHSSGLELYAEPGAAVNILCLEEWSKSLYDFQFLRGRLDQDAYLKWSLANFGARMKRLDVHSQLAGRGASTDMLSLTIADQNQHIEHHTLQEHVKENCKSDLLFKVVLLDRSSSVYRGMIRVHPKAQGTDAYQANRNLLLSSNARADSMPLLEIQANEVRCTHGATISRLDELQLFYLMSRGLPKRLAEKIVVDGFLQPVLDRFPVPIVSDKIRRLWENKISGR
ncbi:MAG: Fe-S cluster assembly protein SufD [Armatimonadetes bacterium]|nr:Fe-S cluster assembly protein SufD [Armatimonadota bacterium]MDW8120814.1 Fe-S cluster assembly protein SufD [Armatimonadota bacterium]